MQHIAFKVKDRETLVAFKERLENNGVPVLGVTDHSIFHSIYFFDPSGHRVELACPDPHEEEMLPRLDAVKWAMLEEWSKTKRAPSTPNGCTARSSRKCDAVAPAEASSYANIVQARALGDFPLRPLAGEG